MQEHDAPDSSAEVSTEAGPDVHAQARDLIRLIQCSQCSLPLRLPVTLPCGNSLCRQCLPPSHVREHITWPGTPARIPGVTCPFPDCGQEHPLDDCSVNVTLTKFMEDVEALVELVRPGVAPMADIDMEESLQVDQDRPETLHTSDALPEKGHSMTAKGGRLLATYDFAKSGQLHYLADVTYSEDLLEDPADLSTFEKNLSEQLRDISKKQMECQICYSLMLDPTSTPCGHTWCRKCMVRVLDHSRLCATCRRELFLPPIMSRQPSNKYLVGLLDAILPRQLAARRETDALDEASSEGGLDTALFICTTSFPDIPVFLHIFEPRYRLMIRRALNANRQFGMLTYNERQAPQGNLGVTQFMEFGTMLRIERFRVLSDGRSFIECRGLYRFRVIEHGMRDGYVVGRVERFEDLGLAEEEALEAQETSREPAETETEESADARLDRMSTEELLAIGTRFVNRAREQSAHWLQRQVIEAYGQAPEDPATFPYWFASVLPMRDLEKYLLMPTTSVRERLKITARWIRRIEAQPWYEEFIRGLDA